MGGLPNAGRQQPYLQTADGIHLGLRLIAPTGDAVLGSGKWRLMRIVRARFALPEIGTSSYFEPLRYDVNVAGDPTNR